MVDRDMSGDQILLPLLNLELSLLLTQCYLNLTSALPLFVLPS